MLVLNFYRKHSLDLNHEIECHNCCVIFSYSVFSLYTVEIVQLQNIYPLFQIVSVSNRVRGPFLHWYVSVSHKLCHMEIAIPYHRGSQGGIAAQLHTTRRRKLCVILPIFTYPQSVARRHGFSVTGNPEKIRGWQQSRSIAEGEKGTGPVPTKSLQGLSHRPRRRNLTEHASLSACETIIVCAGI